MRRGEEQNHLLIITLIKSYAERTLKGNKHVRESLRQDKPDSVCTQCRVSTC